MPVFIGRERTNVRGRLRMGLSMPFIYGMIIPISFLDICIQLYQAVCFRLYGIELIDRRLYVRCTPRGKALLNWVDRFHCWYCSYANGVFNFSRAVAAETEKYWCPIRHASKPGAQEPAHHKGFVPDGDEKALQQVISSYTYKQ